MISKYPTFPICKFMLLGSAPDIGGELVCLRPMGSDLIIWKFLTDAMDARPLKSTRHEDRASYLRAKRA